MSAQQAKAQKMQESQQFQQAQQLFGSGLGGGGFIQQAQQQDMNQ
jgi:hypothetical protein